MKKQIWQFFTDSRRGYDGTRGKEMAEASRALAQRYAEDIGAEYRLETNSVFYASGCHGGPAMDRFQLLEERYLNNYTHRAVMVLSREFRRWLRENCDPLIIEEDAGTDRKAHPEEVHFPCPTQSLMSYFVAKSPYTLTRLHKGFLRGPFFYHFGGRKDDHRIMRYFERYEKLGKRWERTRPGHTRSLLKGLQAEYLRRTTPQPTVC